MSPDEIDPPRLPANAIVEEIAFEPVDEGPKNVLCRLPKPYDRAAVVLGGSEVAGKGAVTVASVAMAESHDDDLANQIRAWVDADSALGGQPTLTIGLQNVHVFWGTRRIAIAGDEKRLRIVRAALVEATFYVNELGELEERIKEMWPDLQADTPAAFEFETLNAAQRKRLGERFREVVQLRSRLAIVTPYLCTPHVYPPTLASQMSERLRERVRAEDRIEFVSDQIEVFEGVYEMCGQRTSDGLHATKGHTLEVVIIVLLGVEVLLMLFEILTRAA